MLLSYANVKQRLSTKLFEKLNCALLLQIVLNSCCCVLKLQFGLSTTRAVASFLPNYPKRKQKPSWLFSSEGHILTSLELIFLWCDFTCPLREIRTLLLGLLKESPTPAHRLIFVTIVSFFLRMHLSNSSRMEITLIYYFLSPHFSNEGMGLSGK